MDSSLYGYSISDFLDEAKDLLSRAENIIQNITEDPQNKEHINALFRAVHSIKGSSAYAGLSSVNTFSHLYEAFLGDIRSGKLLLDDRGINILVRSRDYLEDLIFHSDEESTLNIEGLSGSPLEQLSSILSGRQQQPPTPTEKPAASGSGSGIEGKMDTPSAPPQLKGASQDEVIKITIMNTVKAIYASLQTDTPDLNSLARNLSKLEDSLAWAFSDQVEDALNYLADIKAFISAEAASVDIQKVKKLFNSMALSVKKQLDGVEGRIESPVVVKQPVITETAAKVEQKPVPVPPSEEIRGASKDEIVRITQTNSLATLHDLVNEAPPEPNQIRRVLKRLSDLNKWAYDGDREVKRNINSMDDLLRRPFDETVSREMKTKFSLLNKAFISLLDGKELYVGEVEETVSTVYVEQASSSMPSAEPLTGVTVTPGTQPRTSTRKTAPVQADSVLRVRAEDVESLLSAVGELTGLDAKEMENLHSHILRLRMVPMGDLFGRFRKVVRDLSEELGKEITLNISGESVKLDKVIADRLGEPLMHMVRNAASHGLETRDERVRAGKSGSGAIRLSASQDGGHIIIEVSDDGRGMSVDKIKSRGLETGLIREEDLETLSREDILELIFAPGFSTVYKADKVSGRGVGMDVVREAINSLQGTIDIDTSEGKGTTFRIQLPLTIAVIKAMIFDLGGFRVAVSISSIERAMSFTEEELNPLIFMDRGQASIDLEDEREVIPVADLSTLFGIEKKGEKRSVLVVRCGTGRKAAIVMDATIGRQPLMIKPLDRFAGNRYFSSIAFVENQAVFLFNASSLLQHKFYQ